MKILLIEQGKRLTDEFTKTPLFHVTSQPHLQLISQLDVNAIIIDEEAIPLHTMLEKMIYLEEYPYVFYNMAESVQETIDLCHAKRIIPIVSKEAQTVFEQVKKVIYPENSNSNRVFFFFGADHKAGTTSIVHSVAHSLAQLSTKKVLVVALTPFANDTFCEFSKSSIDNLRIPISSRVVTFLEIMRESDKLKNYHFLAGARDMVHSLDYQVEDILHFIEVLAKQDEYIVLVDGGSDIFNPLTIAGLQHIKNKYVVMKHAESYYRRFEQYIKQVLSVHPAINLTHTSFQYILNEFDESTDTSTYLKEKQAVCIAKIPRSFHGLIAENQYNALHNLDNQYKAAVETISLLIAIKSGTKREDYSEEKKSLFQKLFLRGNKEDKHDVLS